MTQLLLAVFLVLAGSAICSGSEAALFSVPLVRARQLAQGGGGAAQALLRIRENMSRPIATIVILNNIANIVGSIVVGNIAGRILGDEWLGVFSGVLTFLVIIFAEIIPKTLGERFSEPIALVIARPVQLITLILTPLVWLIERLTAPITRSARLPTTNEAEIALLARIGHQEGIIERDESLMIERVFRLNDTRAADLMTPRVNVTYLHGHSILGEVKQQIMRSQHSRIVVIGESIDDVLGIVLKSTLLEALVKGRDQEPIVNFKRDAQFVPESVRADHLLARFQQSRNHLCVVIDEFGGLAGVVTLEDVLELLTGEIVDETDTVVDLQEDARRRIKRIFRQP